MKPYRSYKPSGIEWLGDIPEHWSSIPLKYISKIVLGKMLTPENKGGYLLKPYLRAQNIQWENVSTDDVKEMWFSESELLTYRIFRDEILISEGGEVGRSAIWNEEMDECYIQNSVNKVKIEPGNNPRYFLYLSLVYGKIGGYDSIVNRVSIAHLTKEKLKDIKFLKPQINEQNQIVSFLIDRTHLIDTLISKKQKLIELLKEYRTAIINQAVTKGLDLNVKMKDSGIEWLGEVPEHWVVKRLKFIGAIKYGLGQPPKTLENGLPLIRATNIERGKINENDLIYVDPDDIPYDRDPVLRENDIIVVRSGAYTADSAIIPKKFEGAITGYDLVLRVLKDNPVFISYCLLSNYVLVNQLFLLRMRAAQPHLNREELGDTIIFLPPHNEQNLIALYIITKTNLIEHQIEKEQKFIDYLKEYRTSLISEVVTGKVKVTLDD